MAGKALGRADVDHVDINPFEYGNPVRPEDFYGRRSQIIDVKNRLGALSPQSVSIVGHRRSGKSSLLRQIKERTALFSSPEQQPLIISLDLQDARLHTPTGITEALRRGITRATGMEPWRREDNEDSWAVDDGLAAVRDNGRRIIVLMDEFERIGARLEQFHDWGADMRSKASSAGLFALAIATKRPLNEVYQCLGLTSPFGNIFSITILGALEDDEWRRLVQDGFARSSRELRPAGLDLIDELAGGLPFFTQMAASMLWQFNDPGKARSEFFFQATPHFRALWDDLTELERHTLRYASGIRGLSAPAPAIVNTLLRHGLLRPDGRPFSSVFAEFVGAQK